MNQEDLGVYFKRKTSIHFSWKIQGIEESFDNLNEKMKEKTT